jgi:multidrug efflux pump subunit AcrA (membrane-fusion protein)
MSLLSPVKRFPIALRQIGAKEGFFAKVFTMCDATLLVIVSVTIGFASWQSVMKYKPQRLFKTVDKSGTLQPLQKILQVSMRCRVIQIKIYTNLISIFYRNALI